MERNISRRGMLASGLTAAGATLAAGALSAADADKSGDRNPLTIETLATMLKAMGLDAKKTDSRFDFSFAAKHGEEWTLSMSVVLSTDEKTVWLMAWLDELPQSSSDVPRTALLRLLSDNDKLGNGMFFAYVQSNKRFVLQRVLRNDNISGKSFKADLLELGATVVNSYPHWAVANWKQLGSSASSAKEAKEAAGGDEKSNGSRPAAPAASRTTAKEPAEKKK